MPGRNSFTRLPCSFWALLQLMWSVATVCRTSLSSACQMMSIWSASRSGGQHV